jgi:hypothetical protein
MRSAEGDVRRRPSAMDQKKARTTMHIDVTDLT